MADGGSTDGTRGTLSALAREDARLRWIDNPGRIQARGLKASEAEISTNPPSRSARLRVGERLTESRMS